MRVFHGDIVTCDRDNSVFEYLVEDGGRIVYIGNELTKRSHLHESELVELGDSALLPAFGDGHIHFSNWAVFNSTFDVRKANSIEAIGPIIKDYAASDQKARVITGTGHSMHTVAEKRLITRTELDQIIKDRPIYLVSYDGHSAVANSEAIGLFPQSVRDLRGFNLESGQIQNEAFFKANDYITKKIPVLTMIDYILRGADTLADYGVGLVHTVEGIGFPRDLDVDLVRYLARGAQVNFRIYFQTMDLKKVLKRKLPRVGGCFECALDGCFGAKDAALLEPYTDDPDNRGILFYNDKVVAAFVKQANRAGLQIQLHCIGDAAVVQAVAAIEAALLDYPREDHRHTLIHACLIPEETLEKIASLGIGITLQPGVLTSPLEPMEYLESILGERAHTISPLKKLIEMGIKVSGGSDGSVTEPNPIDGIYAACNYHDPEQSISIPEALRMYNYNIAHTSFDEKERGTLEEGKIADMVILNQNPLKLEPQDLLNLKAEKTYLAGEEYVRGKTIPRAVLDSLRGRSKPV